MTTWTEKGGGAEGLILQTELTCPHCGGQSEHRMATDCCQFFLRCPSCEQMIRPKERDCCVFCSYGTVPCPPEQLAAHGGSAEQL